MYDLNIVFLQGFNFTFLFGNEKFVKTDKYIVEMFYSAVRFPTIYSRFHISMPIFVLPRSLLFVIYAYVVVDNDKQFPHNKHE